MDSMLCESPSRRSTSPRGMSLSPPPPDSIPSLTLDEIIASNRRTAAAAGRTHYANNHNSPRAARTPHLHASPSHSRGTRGHHGNNRRRRHPYSRPKTPAQKEESPAMHAGGGKRLHVSNLAPEVTDAILKKLVSKAGKLVDCSVHYDANGYSKVLPRSQRFSICSHSGNYLKLFRFVHEQGSALIEFANERGAMNALANLQGALLCGMPVVLDILVQ